MSVKPVFVKKYSFSALEIRGCIKLFCKALYFTYNLVLIRTLIR